MFTGVMSMLEENKEKKKYKKKNDFKINIIFNEKGQTLDKIVERAFGNYCQKKNWNINSIKWDNMLYFKIRVSILSHIFL